MSLVGDKQRFKFGGVITHIYMSYLCLFKVKSRKFSSNNKMFILRFYQFAVCSKKGAKLQVIFVLAPLGAVVSVLMLLVLVQGVKRDNVSHHV